MGKHHQLQSWVGNWGWLPHMLRYQGCGCKVSPQEVWQEGRASCGPAKQGLWKDAQLEQIENNCNTVWGSDYEAIKTEQDLTSDRDPSSFQVRGMMVFTDQLMLIKVATHVRNISSQKHEANVNRRKKALVQLLKQFHAGFYQLYEKGMICAMVGLQDLQSGEVSKCPSISAGMGLKSFCPWCFKLGGNTETIAIHLPEVHYWMAIAFDICQEFASMTAQDISDQQSVCKGKHGKECMGTMPVKNTERLRSHKTWKRNQSLTSQGKHPSCRDIRECPKLFRSGEHGSTKDAAKKCCGECCFMSSTVPTPFSEWFHLLFPDGPTSHFWANPHSVRWASQN